MINFGGMLMPPAITRASCVQYPEHSPSDLTTLSSAASENSRRFSVTSLLDLEDFGRERGGHDTDRSEGSFLLHKPIQMSIRLGTHVFLEDKKSVIRWSLNLRGFSRWYWKRAAPFDYWKTFSVIYYPFLVICSFQAKI